MFIRKNIALGSCHVKVALSRVVTSSCCAEPEGDCKGIARLYSAGEPAGPCPLHAWQRPNRLGHHACHAPMRQWGTGGASCAATLSIFLSSDTCMMYGKLHPPFIRCDCVEVNCSAS